MSLNEWMEKQPSENDGGPCQAARDWIAKHQHLTLTQMAKALDKHPRGMLWLWWLAGYLGVPLAALAKAATLRAFGYAAAALERAKLHEHADRLRALPPDCNLRKARALVVAAAKAANDATWAAADDKAWALAAWAAEAVRAAADAAAAKNAAWVAWAAEAAAAVAWRAREEHHIQRESLVPLILAALQAQGVQ